LDIIWYEHIGNNIYKEGRPDTIDYSTIICATKLNSVDLLEDVITDNESISKECIQLLSLNIGF